MSYSVSTVLSQHALQNTLLLQFVKVLQTNRLFCREVIVYALSGTLVEQGVLLPPSPRVPELGFLSMWCSSCVFLGCVKTGLGFLLTLRHECSAIKALGY